MQASTGPASVSLAASARPASAPAVDIGEDRSLSIAGRLIADDERAYLIAEIGHNHGGSIERAMEMVGTAIASGADAVKFQTRVPRDVYAPGSRPGSYGFKSDNPNWMDQTYGVHREKLEFTHDQWAELFSYCREKHIAAFSTPFDLGSVDLLARLGVPAIKIASGDATNTPLIRHAAQVGVTLIISTGGCDTAEVDMVVETMSKTSTPFALLQCTCIYPAPLDALNLRVIETFRDRYPGVVTGLSTHNTSWTPTLAAFALGGRIFEHHYTNDRRWIGTDNSFSLTPAEFAALRAACDEVLPALGRRDKTQDTRERSFTIERRKALYWRQGIAKGRRVTEADLIALCPGEGVPPHATSRLIGRVVTRDITGRERVEWGDVE